MSFNIVDIIIIAIMAIFTLAGFARGFLSSLLKLFSSVASLAVAIWLAKPVAVFIDGIAGLTGWFGDKIASALAGADAVFNYTVGVDIPSQTGDMTGLQLKDLISGSLSELGTIFQEALKLFISDDVTIASGTVLSEWFGSLLGGIATLVTAAVLIYIAIRIAVAILSKIFDAITKNPAIGGLDRLLGLAFGAAKGALTVGVIMAILSVVIILPGVEGLVSPLIENSTIGKPVFDYVFGFVETQVENIDFNSLIQGLFANIGIGG